MEFTDPFLVRANENETGDLCAASWASSTSLSCFLLLVLQEAALVSSTRLNITGSPPPTRGSLGVTGAPQLGSRVTIGVKLVLGTCFVKCYHVCLLWFKSRYLRINQIVMRHASKRNLKLLLLLLLKRQGRISTKN